MSLFSRMFNKPKSDEPNTRNEKMTQEKLKNRVQAINQSNHASEQNEKKEKNKASTHTSANHASAHINDSKSNNKFVAKSSAEFNLDTFNRPANRSANSSANSSSTPTATNNEQRTTDNQSTNKPAHSNPAHSNNSEQNDSNHTTAKPTVDLEIETDSSQTTLPKSADKIVNEGLNKEAVAPMIAGGTAKVKALMPPAEYSDEQIELFAKLPERLQQLVLDTFHHFIRIETSIDDSLDDNLYDSLKVTDSKFGGVPYLPDNLQIDEPYPMSSDNTPLMLLAQINFAQVFAQINHDEFAQLPHQGLLQIFINANDENLGLNNQLDFLQRLPSNNYHVRFFPSIDENAKQLQNVAQLANASIDEVVLDEVFSPISTPLKLSFSKAFGCAGVSENLLEFIEANQGQAIDELDYENGEKEDLAYEALNNLSNASGHKLLGMPVFPNEEVRKPYSKQRLLLQIDSEYPMNEDYGIMWGDMGVANFFITPDDLAKQNFAKLIYNWDCE